MSVKELSLQELIDAMRVTANPKPVPVPAVEGWPKLYVRPPTVEEVDRRANAVDTEKDKKHRFAKGAARVICNSNGVLLFDEDNTEHLELLAAQPWAMLQKVLTMADPDKGITPGN